MHSIAADALMDLIEFGEELVQFASGKDTASDEIERMRYLAIERLFELLGECMNRALAAEPTLSLDFSDAHRVISMRNRIAHEYDGVDPEVVWETALIKVPVLLRTVQGVLDSAGER